MRVNCVMKTAAPVPMKIVILHLLVVPIPIGRNGLRVAQHVLAASNHVNVALNGQMTKMMMSVSPRMTFVTSSHVRRGRHGDHGPAAARIAKHLSMRPYTSKT